MNGFWSLIMKKVILTVLSVFVIFLVVFSTAKFYSWEKHYATGAYYYDISVKKYERSKKKIKEEDIQFVKETYDNLSRMSEINKRELASLSFLIRLSELLWALDRDDKLSQFLQTQDVAALIDKVTDKGERLFLASRSLGIKPEQLKKYFKEALLHAQRGHEFEPSLSPIFQSITSYRPNSPYLNLIQFYSNLIHLYPGVFLSLPFSSEEKFWLLNIRYIKLIDKILSYEDFRPFQEIMDSYSKIGFREKLVVYAGLARNRELSGAQLNNVFRYIMDLKIETFKKTLLEKLVTFNPNFTKNLYQEIAAVIGYENISISRLLESEILSENDKKELLKQIIDNPNLKMTMLDSLIKILKHLQKAHFENGENYEDIYTYAKERRKQLNDLSPR